MAAGLIVVCLVAAAVVLVAVRNYLHSDAFRQLLSEKVSAAAGVEGGFSPLRWDGFSLDTDSFAATGDGPVRELRVDGLHTEVAIGGVRRGVWDLRNSRARRLAVKLDTRGPQDAADPPREPRPTAEDSKQGGWLPRKVEVNGLALDEVSLEALTANGPLTARGMRLEVEKSGGPDSYRAVISGGTVTFPGERLPVLRLDRARIHAQPLGVFLTGLEAGAWSAARLEADGEWDRATKRLTLDGRVSDVKCEEILSEDWARRLNGKLSSDFVMRSADDRTAANGRLVLENGILTALPVLDVLAAYLDTSRFRTLVLSEAHADWRWQDGEMVFGDIVFASESQIRLEGNLVIRDRQLDGRFMLGVAPGTLSSVPGAETHVFTPGTRGMLWAPMRVTGTLDKPREDLSDRMITAAGLRLLETIPGSGGEKVLKFSRAVLGDNPQEAVERGVKIIEEGSRTVREVSGLLDGILGGGREPAPDDPDR
ncbi:MAG TPA: hypothetical protein VLO11_13155 [Luteolibacter sp.]|nr:hypothetical protein [Luteolibacter sp.]